MLPKTFYSMAQRALAMDVSHARMQSVVERMPAGASSYVQPSSSFQTL